MIVLVSAAPQAMDIPDQKWMSYMCWGVLAKTDISIVKSALEEMLVSYPFLSTSDYNVVLKLCAAAVEPE